MRVAALLLLAGCAPKALPSIYPDPAPAAELPELPEPAPVANPCPRAAGLVAGAVPPFVDEAGLATCNATLVPPSDLQELLAADVLGEWGVRQLAICNAGRARDRAHGDVEWSACQDARRAAARDAAAQRVIGAGLFVVGVGIGVAAASVAP